MCGIVGVTGTEDALRVILDGLGRLEYRGYDSAGVVLAEGGGLRRTRMAQGTHSVSDLVVECEIAPGGGRTGIGHTRWATHGQPTVLNAHPHLDCSGEVAIVHNGIIENHAVLAAGCHARGHQLCSDTDSEVLSHLIEEELGGGASLFDAVRSSLGLLTGTFAVAAMHASEPEAIVASRRVSPLVLGRAGETWMLASDIPALLEHTEELFVLDDDQIVELRPGSIKVATLSGESATLAALEVDWSAAACSQDGFADFMTKEIHEQPQALAATMGGHIGRDGLVELGTQAGLSDADLLGIDRLVIVACGSSFHAGLVAKYAFESWARLPVDVQIASEFRSREPVLDSSTLVIGVSQSGETIDTLQGLREARRRGAPSAGDLERRGLVHGP